jgi:peptidyl-prolyl cis-trans isomerase SurA
MPELDTVVFTLEEGAFSPPIQSALGFHLVKVGGRRASSPQEGLDAKQAAEQELFQRKFNEAFTQWISELRRQAYIELRVED